MASTITSPNGSGQRTGNSSAAALPKEFVFVGAFHFTHKPGRLPIQQRQDLVLIVLAVGARAGRRYSATACARRCAKVVPARARNADRGVEPFFGRDAAQEREIVAWFGEMSIHPG